MTHDFAKTLKRTEEELKLAGYSPRTVSSYLGVASRFLRFADRPAEKIGRDDVSRYFVYLTERGQAPSSINQAHFGVRFLIKEVLKKEWRQPLRLHKRPERMPIVLSRAEVRTLLISLPARSAGPGGRVSGVRKSAIIGPAEPRKLRVPAKIVTGRADLIPKTAPIRACRAYRQALLARPLKGNPKLATAVPLDRSLVERWPIGLLGNGYGRRGNLARSSDRPPVVPVVRRLSAYQRTAGLEAVASLAK